MNREQFITMLDGEFSRIKDLFALKNKAYGSQDDLFYNFRETARRELPEEYRDNESAAMYKVAEIYVDKHAVALAKGIAVNEVRERLQDRIVYSLIQIAMIDDMDKQEPKKKPDWITEGLFLRIEKCDCCGRYREVKAVKAADNYTVHICKECAEERLKCWHAVQKAVGE